jgi:acetate kinase
MKILVLNCGSSSLKSSLYCFVNHQLQPISPAWEGSLQWKGGFDDVSIEIKNDRKVKKQSKIGARTLDEARFELMNSLSQGDTAVISSLDEIDAIGHRIVHGGRTYRESVRIDSDVKDKIRELAEFAPLHNMAALKGIEAMEKILQNKPQIAVFDTAFHHTLSPEASIYPGPYKWFEQGIQRYGFHGISYQYCARRAEELLQQDLRSLKMVICHLGAGASLCAVDGGKSVDTTMGFTPLEGLMMNTRSGTIDPGIVLERMKHVDLPTLTNELYRESGLLGISGVSSDMREIFKSIQTGHPRAQLAFEVYIHRLSACIGSMIASLKGMNVLIFTAGIGENTPLLRQRICDRFAFLGIRSNARMNKKPPPEDCDIAKKSSKIRVLIIHTQEAFEIARECWRLIHKIPK